MFKPIEALDAYNKNINILIGSGGAADIFPTLAMEIKDEKGDWETIEKLATKLETYHEKHAVLFMHYYNTGSVNLFV